MAIHSFTFICIHMVWAVENHQKTLLQHTRLLLSDHLVKLSDDNNLGIISLSVQPDHVHLLYNHPPELTVANAAKLLKGESSRWINENDLVLGRFRWQRGYGAFSVSKTNLDKVKSYIKNQDEHHRRKSYTEEFQAWIKNSNLGNASE